jgi:ABC-type dipeptide/oligopeptide/nickel transport system permease component
VTAWLVRRVGAALAIVFAVVTLTFFLLQLAPGRPMTDPNRPMDPDRAAELCRQFGCDGPLWLR